MVVVELNESLAAQVLACIDAGAEFLIDFLKGNAIRW